MNITAICYRPKGSAIKKTDSSQRHTAEEAMDTSCRKENSCWKNNFTMQEAQPKTRDCEAVGSPSLEVFTTQLNKVMSLL